MENGEIPENAPERMYIFLILTLKFASFFFDFIVYRIFFVSLIFFFSDCPGTQSETAGKSDACQGCPNQEICATAPKGPDPGHCFTCFLA